MQSTSVMKPITGLPEPQVATQAVGMPATPRSTLKPFFSSIAVTYRDVSISWNPSSLKLKIWSTDLLGERLLRVHLAQALRLQLLGARRGARGRRGPRAAR